MSEIYEIPLKSLDGKPASLGDYAGKVLLVVNVASKCGLTPQYEGLQKLYAARQAEGLEVLGFPANDFAGQEPGTAEEIAGFCATKYDVTFPLFEKTSIVGAGKNPLYAALIAAAPDAAGSARTRRRRCCGISRNSWWGGTARWSGGSRRIPRPMIRSWWRRWMRRWRGNN
jgi:glutathione peroxidase